MSATWSVSSSRTRSGCYEVQFTGPSTEASTTLTGVYMYMYNDVAMASRKLYSLWLDPDLLEGLKLLKERVGVSESETLRRALRAWLEQHDAIAKPGRKRAVTRKRP